MDAKISSDFWGDPAIEALTKDQRMAALWAMTGERTTLFGFVEVTARRFEFETGCPYEALRTLPEAHAKGFKQCGDGIWIRRFIARQFGTGTSLVRNNFCKPILNALRACEGLPVFNEVLLEYPELQEPYDSLFYLSPELDLGRAYQAPEKRRVEKNSAEQSSEPPISPEPNPSTPAGEGSNSSAKKEKKAGAVGADALLYRARALFWNDARRTMPADFTLDEAESRAWKKNGAAVAATSEDDWLHLEWAYTQRTGDAATYRRKALAQLLNNWNGALSSARDWAKRAGARIGQAVPVQLAPTGWEAGVQELFPGCDTSRGWASLTPDVQAGVLEFLKNNPPNTQ